MHIRAYKKHNVNNVRRHSRSGTGDSGKSTFMKQLKIVNLNGYTYSERTAFKAIIYRNIVMNMQTLLAAARARGLELTVKQRYVDALLQADTTWLTDLDALARPLRHCARDEALNELAQQGHDFHLQDSFH